MQRINDYTKEASWPSGVGRWCCNPEVPGSRPRLHPTTGGICFSVVSRSNLSIPNWTIYGVTPLYKTLSSSMRSVLSS